MIETNFQTHEDMREGGSYQPHVKTKLSTESNVKNPPTRSGTAQKRAPKPRNKHGNMTPQPPTNR